MISIDFTYLLKVSLSLTGFYLFFSCLLKNTAYFQLNRLYLLAGLCLSFLIPRIAVEKQYSEFIPAVDTWTQNVAFVNVPSPNPQAYEETFGLINVISILYCCGVAIVLLRLSGSLVQNIRLVWNARISQRNGYRIAQSDQVETPCSFFTFILYPANEQLHSEAIFAHECGHVRQGHSLDLLVIEIATAFLWFNPFIFLYRKSLRLQHEYLADTFALKRCAAENYLTELLQAAINNQRKALVSPFNHSTIKKRIQMMTEYKASHFKKLGYFLALPFMLLILFAFRAPSQHTAKIFQSPFFVENQFIKDLQPLLVSFQTENEPSISPIKKQDIKRFSSNFGMKIHPISKVRKMHAGIDIVSPAGTPVVSTARGKVIKTVDNHESVGNQIVISHGEHYQTVYNHLHKIDVQEGQLLEKGEQIGTVGSTGKSKGPHLHYEVWKDKEAVDPKNYL